MCAFDHLTFRPLQCKLWGDDSEETARENVSSLGLDPVTHGLVVLVHSPCSGGPGRRAGTRWIGTSSRRSLAEADQSNETSRSTGGAEAADGKDAGKKKQRSGAARRANTKRKKKDQTDEPEQDPAHQVAKARRKRKEKKHLMVGRSIHPAIPTGKRFLADPHGRRRRRTTPPLTCVASPPVPGWRQPPCRNNNSQLAMAPHGAAGSGKNPGPGDRGGAGRGGEGPFEKSVTGDCACRSATASQQTGSLSGEPALVHGYGVCPGFYVLGILVTSGVVVAPFGFAFRLRPRFACANGPDGRACISCHRYVRFTDAMRGGRA